MQRAATDYEAFYSRTGFDFREPTTHLFVLMFNHKGFVLQKEVLTEATGRVVESSPHKMDT